MQATDLLTQLTLLLNWLAMTIASYVLYFLYYSTLQGGADLEGSGVPCTEFPITDDCNRRLRLTDEARQRNSSTRIQFQSSQLTLTNTY